MIPTSKPFLALTASDLFGFQKEAVQHTFIVPSENKAPLRQ
jgi:hypothetical protein